MKIFLLCICLSATSASLFAQEQTMFTVGSATAAAGRKARGIIPVPAGGDAGSAVPVVVVQGATKGPVLAITAGSHGTEYSSIIAVEQLISVLNESEIAGTVILLPLLNVASFEQKVPHLNPVDGKNMNRVFPGKLNGTQSERIAYFVTSQVLERADHVIDMHGGDLDENLRPYSYWTKTGNEKQDAISREMVLAFGLDHIIISANRPKDPMQSLYLENTATTRGKPSITVEAGYAGSVDSDDVTALVSGCLNVMRYLKMLPNKPQYVEHPVWIDNVITVNAEQTGMFFPTVKKGSYAERGMKLGYITDYTGRLIFEARAPLPGIVLFIGALPSMKKGDTVANIGTLASSPPPAPAK